jgi:hypothetical protein
MSDTNMISGYHIVWRIIWHGNTRDCYKKPNIYRRVSEGRTVSSRSGGSPVPCRTSRYIHDEIRAYTVDDAYKPG